MFHSNQFKCAVATCGWWLPSGQSRLEVCPAPREKRFGRAVRQGQLSRAGGRSARGRHFFGHLLLWRCCLSEAWVRMSNLKRARGPTGAAHGVETQATWETCDLALASGLTPAHVLRGPVLMPTVPFSGDLNLSLCPSSFPAAYNPVTSVPRSPASLPL